MSPARRWPRRAQSWTRRCGRDEPTYGVTTGFGRFVSTRVPGELAEELQLRLLRSHACGVGEPYPDEIVRAAMLMRANALAKGYSGTRVEVAELLLDCLGRDVIPEVPSRGSVGASGDLAPLAHLALPLVGEGRARVDGELLSGADALARAGLEPLRLAGEGRALARQRHAVHGRVRRARARAGDAPREGGGRRLRALGRRAPGLARQLPAEHPRAPAAAGPGRRRRRTSSRCSTARRSSRRTAGAIASRTRTRLRCAAQVHGASRDLLALRRATPPPPSSTRRRTTRSSSPRTGRCSRTGTSTASRVAFALDALAMAVSELGEHLRAPDRAARQPRALRRAAGVPRDRRRAQLRVHDPAVRRRLARQREQGALPSRERRLDPDERRPGGSRVDGQRGGAEGVAGARERRARRRDRAARGCAGGRVPRAARAGRRAREPRASSCGRSRRGSATTVRSSDDIEALAAAIRDGSALAAVEAEAGELA